jgi:hypothetical protein
LSYQPHGIAHTDNDRAVSEILHELLPSLFIFTSWDTPRQMFGVDQMRMRGMERLTLFWGFGGVGRVSSSLDSECIC